MGICFSSNDQELLEKIASLESANAALTRQLQEAAYRVPVAYPPPPQPYPPQPYPPQPYAAQAAYPHASQPAAAVMEVLWFPDPAMPCRNYQQRGSCQRPNCTYAHQPTSLTRLLAYLNHATTSLDVCVFTITCNELADALVAAHRRGVRVRVVTDNDQATRPGSDVQQLQQAGIGVRQDKDQYHMHMKYAVIDHRILLNGSFNWTRQAVLNNQENVLLLDNAAMVQQFAQHFEKLWGMYR